MIPGVMKKEGGRENEKEKTFSHLDAVSGIVPVNGCFAAGQYVCGAGRVRAGQAVFAEG